MTDNFDPSSITFAPSVATISSVSSDPVLPLERRDRKRVSDQVDQAWKKLKSMGIFSQKNLQELINREGKLHDKAMKKGKTRAAARHWTKFMELQEYKSSLRHSAAQSDLSHRLSEL